jgi:hypothetical protein
METSAALKMEKTTWKGVWVTLRAGTDSQLTANKETSFLCYKKLNPANNLNDLEDSSPEPPNKSLH